MYNARENGLGKSRGRQLNLAKTLQELSGIVAVRNLRTNPDAIQVTRLVCGVQRTKIGLKQETAGGKMAWGYGFPKLSAMVRVGIVLMRASSLDGHYSREHFANICLLLRCFVILEQRYTCSILFSCTRLIQTVANKYQISYCCLHHAFGIIAFGEQLLLVDKYPNNDARAFYHIFGS